VIVGCEIIGNREFVYYLDPSDSSDPNASQDEKIYVMSYASMISGKVCDLFGICNNIAPEGVGYGYYLPTPE